MLNKDQAGGAEITLHRGSLYLGSQTYERYFAGLDAVILLKRDEHLYIMPVRNSAGGGYLLKLKNSAGDRIVNAMDFFREHAMDFFEERIFDVFWDQDMVALKVPGFFITVN